LEVSAEAARRKESEMKLRVLALSVLVCAAFLALNGLGPTAAANHLTKCFGQRADINQSHDSLGSFLVGTSGHDVIIGSPDRDHIEGRGGRDFICGIGGRDEIRGGRRADKLSGGPGDDEISGGRGGDLIKGGTGHDRANGGPGWDTCVNIEVRTSCEVVR
jgi:Ca2+-binding RTX toxin-like protein